MTATVLCIPNAKLSPALHKPGFSSVALWRPGITHFMQQRRTWRRRRSLSDEPQASPSTSLRLCTPTGSKSRVYCNSPTRMIIGPGAKTCPSTGCLSATRDKLDQPAAPSSIISRGRSNRTRDEPRPRGLSLQLLTRHALIANNLSISPQLGRP